MDLKGKKVNFLGDSITEGVGTSALEYRYADVTARLLQLGEARNYGISGTRIARQTHPTTNNPRFDLDFCARALEMDTDADVVVVFGGTNDFGHGDAALGNMADRDVYTFYGACHTLMQTLRCRYIDSEIVFMTPLHRICEEAEGKAPLSTYVKIIKEVAEYYSIPVLDLYATSGINPIIPEVKEKYMPDGLHPSDRGAEVVAKRLAAFLKAL